MIPFDLLVGAVLDDAPRVDRASRSVVRECVDPLARMLADLGWTGRQNRVAWAVVMRESNGRADVVATGGYGLFQLQAEAWADADWWDWDAVLDARSNARMARLVYDANGWRPWGLTRDGRAVDDRDYGGWTADQKWRWIWEPYAAYLKDYPC